MTFRRDGKFAGREIRPRGPRTCALLLVVLAAGAGARAGTDEDELDDGPRGGLLPIPGLLRPQPPPPTAGGPDAGQAPVVIGGCASKPLAVVTAGLPFGPGEVLGFDVAVLGVRTGRVRLKVGDKTEVDGVPVYALHANAKTTGFLSVFGELDGRMVSYLDPRALLPVRMVNQTRTKSPFQPPLVIREDAAFGTDGRAAARLQWNAENGERISKGKAKATSDLVDVLSVVYYIRARQLDEGAPFCFEIYHRRRLWRAEGKVQGVETVSPPWGAHRGRRLDATLRLVGGGRSAPVPRPFSVWLSTDADRLPLLVRTPDRLGDIEVRLRSFTAGRRLVRAPR